ncbi:MAG: YkgJ family cysteine cluster protein [Deltaproteobacteria bacterium]|nr:YkgJ family cysteine cluster protein [Deltaproteobacteria bacterium]
MSKQVESMEKRILEEYPRMGADDTFCFECHAGLSCFTQCCRDVSIALTPYDVLRLKNRLQMKSQDFVEQHILLPPMAQKQKLPTPFLKMNEEDNKRCPFVKEGGCSVYEDRPWACRMYPVGLASSRSDAQPDGEEFFFLIRSEVCKGLDRGRTMTIREWQRDQQTQAHDAANEAFKAVTLHRFLRDGYVLEPEHRQMFFMACYNLDRFREFVFQSSFLKKFEIDPKRVDALSRDDEELLKFAYEWVRFALFHERTLSVDRDYEQAKRKVLSAQ